MSKRIVCFGEIMMRLNPESYLRFVQADKFECSYAGGEANVAVSLANYGMDASYVTKLPDNPLGAAARNEVRRFGVDTKDIVWGGPRLGIYFVEKGASQRASKVVYDRAGSSIATASDRHRLPQGFRLGEDLQGREVVPLHGHHPRAWRRVPRNLP